MADERKILTVYSDHDLGGVRRRQGSVDGINAYFTHIPPEKRKRTAAHHCPIGGEDTRDYWYAHDTGKAGDTKLCVEHEVIEVEDPRYVIHTAKP